MRFLQEMRRHPDRLRKTLVLWLCFLTLGLNLALVGPTLLDLRHIVCSGIREVSLSLPARAAGQAIGSFASKLTSFLSLLSSLMRSFSS